MTLRAITSTEEWLEWRQDYVCASEVAALLGVQADYQLSPYTLYYVKTGEVQAPFLNNDEYIGWGNDFEDAIARVAARREKWTIGPGMFATDDAISCGAATLDRVILPCDNDLAYPGPGVLEVKNVSWAAFASKWTDGEPPPWILIQLQDQLACTGWQWGAVTACISGNEYYCRRYRRNEDVIAAIREAKTEFWAMLQARTPPKPDHYASTTDTLRKLYPDTRAKTLVDLMGDNEMPGLCSELISVTEQRKELEKRETGLQNQIRAKVGPNEKALVNGFSVSRFVGAGKPDRPAVPGEIIKGRKGQDRLTVSEKGKA